MADVVAFPTYDDLCRYVHGTLCALDALDQTQTPLFQTPLHRRGRPWGMVFHVEGPRQLITSATWAADDGRLVFYNSLGLRTHEVLLSESPSDVGSLVSAPSP